MNKKMLGIASVLFILMTVGAFAQWNPNTVYYDMMGTVVSYVMESLSPSQERQINGITVNGCNYVPDGYYSNARYISWRDACDQHDLDYANPNMTKRDADLRLRQNMINQGAPVWLAQLYYEGLQTRLSQSFWERAQMEGRR